MVAQEGLIPETEGMQRVAIHSVEWIEEWLKSFDGKIAVKAKEYAALLEQRGFALMYDDMIMYDDMKTNCPRSKRIAQSDWMSKQSRHV